jgi:transposase-like protein
MSGQMAVAVQTAGAAAPARRVPRRKRRYTDQAKAAALALLGANGRNVSKTAADTGIPVTTLWQWGKGLFLHPPVSALRAGAGGGPAPPRGASPSRPSSTAAWSGARSTAPRPWSPRTCLPSSLARGSCWRARPRTGSKAV